jgi:hypothetical protein
VKEELEMELLWYQNRNKELQDKKADEEFITMMNTWAQAKSKV